MQLSLVIAWMFIRFEILPLNAAGCVTSGEPIDFANRQPVEVTWNGLLQRARRNSKPQRRLRIASGDRKSTRLELQSQSNLVCRLLLEKKKKKKTDVKLLS